MPVAEAEAAPKVDEHAVVAVAPRAEVHTRSFIPRSLTERLKYASELSMAGLLPRVYQRSPANLLLAMDYADSLGIPLSQALGSIAVIDGKPSAQASLISALVRRAGHRLRVKFDGTKAIATIHRFDDPEFEYRAEWDIPRAVRAGLVEIRDGKPWARVTKDGRTTIKPWEAYPEAMMKARAVTEVARDACQEALMGLQYTPEELGAIVNEDGSVVDDPGAGRDAKRQEPAEVKNAEPAIALHPEFQELVKEAEAAYDLPLLRELYDHAHKAQDVSAKAFAMSAGTRVKKHLEAHPEDAPTRQTEEEAQAEAGAVHPAAPEELDGVPAS